MSKSPDAFRTISEVAEDLDLPQHVLRFWETRFGHIRPLKRGGGRRYSPRDIERLREISELTSAGIGIEGVRRILELENRAQALSARNQELVAELEATRQALREALNRRAVDGTGNKLPVLHRPQLGQPQPGQAVVVWRRGR